MEGCELSRVTLELREDTRLRRERASAQSADTFRSMAFSGSGRIQELRPSDPGLQRVCCALVSESG